MKKFNDSLFKEILAHEKEMRPEFHNLLTSKDEGGDTLIKVNNYIGMLESNLDDLYKSDMLNISKEETGKFALGANFNDKLIAFKKDTITDILNGIGDDPNKLRKYLAQLVKQMQEAEKIAKKAPSGDKVDWGLVATVFAVVGMIGPTISVGSAVATQAGGAAVALMLIFGTATGILIFLAILAVLIAVILLILKLLFEAVECSFLLLNFFFDKDVIIKENYALDGVISRLPPLNSMSYGIPAGVKGEHGEVVFGDFIQTRKRYGSTFGSTGGFEFVISDSRTGSFFDSFYALFYNGYANFSKNGVLATTTDKFDNAEKFVRKEWKKAKGKLQAKSKASKTVLDFKVDAKKGGSLGGYIKIGPK